MDNIRSFVMFRAKQNKNIRFFVCLQNKRSYVFILFGGYAAPRKHRVFSRCLALNMMKIPEPSRMETLCVFDVLVDIEQKERDKSGSSV